MADATTLEIDELSNSQSHSPDDDRPVTARRKKRRTISTILSSPIKHSHNLRHGINTPPQTPQRRKRVKFLQTSPTNSATGLTPFIRKTALGTPSSRRISSRWASGIDDSPISGSIHFVPLRQVLTGRVKRRIRRNGLSEEINIIDSEKRNHEKIKKEAEILKARLREKDAEIAWLREEQEIVNQIEDESDSVISRSTPKIDLIHKLEDEIARLKGELVAKQRENDVQDRTTFSDDDRVINDIRARAWIDHNHNNEFLVEGKDIFTSTPVPQVPFSSLNAVPASPDGPSASNARPTIFSNASTQASLPDPEVMRLRNQLQTLQAEIDMMTALVESRTVLDHRLLSKLSPYANENDSLDSALDEVLTALTISRAQSKEHGLRLASLATELNRLGVSSCPEESIKIILAQFRHARIELERLHPGETAEGFENAKLLDLLLNRVRFLTSKVEDLDADLDTCIDTENTLRQQLSSRVDVARAMEESLLEQAGQIIEMTADLVDSEANISQLTRSLETFTKQVTDLQITIERIHAQHALEREELTLQIQVAKTDGDQRILSEQLQRDIVLANNEGLQMLVQELQSRYQALGAIVATLRNQIYTLDSRSDDHDFELAQVQSQLQSSQVSLKNANDAILLLKAEVAGLEAQVVGEQGRHEDILDIIRAQLAGVIDMASGFSATNDHALSGSTYISGSTRGRSNSMISIRSTTEDDCRLFGKDREVVVLAEARRSAGGFYGKLFSKAC